MNEWILPDRTNDYLNTHLDDNQVWLLLYFQLYVLTVATTSSPSTLRENVYVMSMRSFSIWLMITYENRCYDLGSNTENNSLCQWIEWMVEPSRKAMLFWNVVSTCMAVATFLVGVIFPVFVSRLRKDLLPFYIT